MPSNPYHGQTLIGFLLTFFQRLVELCLGHISFSDLASDEVQIFVLMGVSLSSALVGTFLVLRRMTMLANSLSHTILIGIVLAYFLTRAVVGDDHTPVSMTAMLFAALLMGLCTTFLTQFLTKAVKIHEDASTGMVFTSLFALGVVLVTVLTRNAHIGTEAVMGNADALHREDLYWVYAIAAVNMIVFALFYKEYQLTTFDPGLAYALGISPLFFNYLLMTQVSATAITSFRAVGVLLVLAFLTGPVLAARLLTHKLKILLAVAVGLGCLSALFGVALTRHLLTAYGMALSTSGVVVCTILVLYLMILSVVLIKGRIVRKTPVPVCDSS